MFELFQFAAQSSGKSAEMNGLAQTVVFRAASLLILQLAVIGSAQQTVPLPASAPGSSASPTGNIAVAESSQSQGQAGAVGPSNGTIAKPGKAGGKGDPAFGGERHPLYRLTKSDTVDLNFTFSPEFNRSEEHTSE